MMKTRRSLFTLASSSVLALALGAGPVFADSWGSSGGSSGGGFLHHGGGGSSGGGSWRVPAPRRRLQRRLQWRRVPAPRRRLQRRWINGRVPAPRRRLQRRWINGRVPAPRRRLQRRWIDRRIAAPRWRLQRRILLTSLGYRHWLGGTDGNSVQDIGDDTKSNSQHTRSTHDEDSAVFLHSCLIELSGLGPWGRACVRGFVGFQRRRVPSPRQWWRVQRRWSNRRIGAPPPIRLGVVP